MMKKETKLTKIRLVSALIFSVFLFVAVYAGAQDSSQPAAQSEILEIKGQVKAVSNKAKTISLEVTGKGVVILKFNDETKFINAESGKDIEPPTGVIVKYKKVGPDNVATSITKALVKLPAGVTEIKTDELASLVEKGTAEGKYCLIDSRPAKIASAAHIPTAISIPVDLLKEKGEKLLPCGKDKMIIFYCGGPT
ncbi:MAG: rhodanese-like domain-containing protein [Desulfobacterales bacterium]|nr:rhodanese-like domain-containing protein [Desulfobacterales bacterium]